MVTEANGYENNARDELVGRLMLDQEAERKRVARQLQDGINQEVAVLGLLVSDIKRHLPVSMAQAHTQLTQVQQRLTALAKDIEDLSHKLYPATLDHAGLVAALRSYCAEFSRQTGLVVNVSAPAKLQDVPPDMALCLYRITQAFLEDITRTLRPGRIKLTLTWRADTLRLTLMAYDPKLDLIVGSGHGRLGLPDLDVRVRHLQGSLCITRQPKLGTNLGVSLPWRGVNHESDAHPPR